MGIVSTNRPMAAIVSVTGPDSGGVSVAAAVGVGGGSLGGGGGTGQSAEQVLASSGASQEPSPQTGPGGGVTGAGQSAGHVLVSSGASQTALPQTGPEGGGGAGGVQDWDAAGLGVAVLGQSKVILHVRVCVPPAEQADQAPQDHVSWVQDGGGGVQDCVVAGLGVLAVGQSKVILHGRD